MALRIVERSLKTLRMIIIARILVPKDFGLMGIVLLTLGTFRTFSEIGVEAALVQKKTNVEKYLNTAWTLGLVRRGVLFLGLFLLAPLVAKSFNEPQATLLLRVAAIAFLLQGLSNISTVFIQRNMAFNKQFIYQIGGSGADFVISILAAVILRSVWAFIYGLLAGEIAKCILSHILFRNKLRLEWDSEKVKSLWIFGKWLFGSSVLVFLITHVDDILVGKYLGTSMLAFYQMAYRIAGLPASEIGSVVSTVMFPAYSKVQDNLALLRQGYLKSLQMTALVAIPLGGCIFVLSSELTRILLGEEWLPMVPALRVLAIFGVIRALVMPGPLFMAIGKPELRTKLQLQTFIILAILLFPFTYYWQILGTAIAVVVASGLTGFYAVGIALREVHANYMDGVKVIFPAIITTSLTLFGTHWLANNVLEITNIWNLATAVAMGVISYGLFILLMDLLFDIGNIRLIREQVRTLSKN